MIYDKGAVIRFALLGLSFINGGLALFGKSSLPIENEQLELAVSFLFMLGTSAVGAYKNNPTSDVNKKYTDIMRAEKLSKK